MAANQMSQNSTGQVEEKDQNVYSFMMQIVQEKHGDDIDMDILNSEADILYDIFGDVLLQYFEPQLNAEQKQQFDKYVEAGEDQDNLLNFLVEVIPDLEQQIIQVLVKFRTDYLSGKLEAQAQESQVDQEGQSGSKGQSGQPQTDPLT
jgi:hypothetical protein